MANEVIIGTGNATGMFYHAPAGTALPTSPLDELDKAWTKVGDVTSDGITFGMDRSTDDLRNWANKIKRTIMTEHSETVQAPIMDTTEEVFKTILGESNVSTTAATTDHGKLVKATLSAESLPDPEAFLFLMKDGDVAIALGCEKGQVSELDNVTFAPGSAINWTPTIKGLDNGWTLIEDDGQKNA